MNNLLTELTKERSREEQARVGMAASCIVSIAGMFALSNALFLGGLLMLAGFFLVWAFTVKSD